MVLPVPEEDMNAITRYFVRRKWKALEKENPQMAQTIVFFATRIFWLASVIVAEWNIIIGIVEKLIQALLLIVSTTESKEDDATIQAVHDLFDVWKSKIYAAAEKIKVFYGTWNRLTGK
jgi:hypothetical protein